jgi:hypothetical protein
MPPFKRFAKGEAVVSDPNPPCFYRIDIVIPL